MRDYAIVARELASSKFEAIVVRLQDYETEIEKLTEAFDCLYYDYIEQSKVKDLMSRGSIKSLARTLDSTEYYIDEEGIGYDEVKPTYFLELADVVEYAVENSERYLAVFYYLEDKPGKVKLYYVND